MITSFIIHDGDARKHDLDKLRSMGFEVTPSDNGSSLIELPVGWKLERKGCYLYEIEGPSGETIRYSRNIRCLLIQND